MASQLTDAIQPDNPDQRREHSNLQSSYYQPKSTRPRVLIGYAVFFVVTVGFLGWLTASAKETEHAFSSSTHDDEPTCEGCDTAPSPAHQLTLSEDFTAADFFAIVYLPKILAVILTSAWAITYARTKMLEPYYSLCSKRGASVDELFYNLFSTNARTFVHRNRIRLTAAVNLCLCLVAALVSEAFVVVPTDTCDGQPCKPALEIRFGPTLAITILLAVTVFLICSIFPAASETQRQLKRGFGDPSSISYISALLTDESVVEDLLRVDPLASEEEACQTLRGKRYHLGIFQSNSGEQRYGIYTKDKTLITHGNATSSLYQPVSNPTVSSSRRRQSPNFLKTLISDTIQEIALLLLTICLFVLVLTYKCIGQSTSSFNNFMNSASFGPRVVLSGLAVLISVGLRRIEARVRVTEVYYHMARQPQPASCSVLLGVAMSPWTGIAAGLRRRHWFATLLSFVAVLSDLLLIAVSGVPFGTGQTSGSYEASTAVTLTILVLVSLVLVAAMAKRRAGPNIPRIPDTLGNVMLYLCGSNMVGNDFLALCHSDAQNSHDQSRSSTFYSFGKDWTRDGRVRWTLRAEQRYSIEKKNYTKSDVDGIMLGQVLKTGVQSNVATV